MKSVMRVDSGGVRQQVCWQRDCWEVIGGVGKGLFGLLFALIVVESRP